MSLSNYHQHEALIFLVDDSLINLKLQQKVICQHGYNVDIAEDAISALQKIEIKKPDLILLDIQMPGMDGHEFCRILKARPDTEQIPIIFLSASSESSEKVKAFSNGAADFITKPAQHIEVIIRIEYHLKIAKLQRELLEKNRILEQEIQQRRQIEKLLIKKKERLEEEVKQRKYMELLWLDNNAQLNQQANIDVLTQVPNRRYFETYLEQTWQRSIRKEISLSIVLCDIDYFKNYNDYYGHPAGDKCLFQVAQTLAKKANLIGNLVARYGGEEFIVVLPDTDELAAVSVIFNIKQSLANLKIPHERSETSDYVTMSFGGVTLNPKEKTPIDVLIKQADESLYRAKHQGRNQICWHT